LRSFKELQDRFGVSDVGQDQVGGVEQGAAFDGKLDGVEG
jgi:hypothetical protein